MDAQEILNQALKEMDARGKQSKDGTKERSMAATVTAFNAITGRELTETEGWMFMVVLKAVRTVQRVGSIDSFVDGAAYFSLAGESVQSVNLEQSKPIPSWAKWIAQDANGNVWVYENKPTHSDEKLQWENLGIGKATKIKAEDPNLYYKDTLREL